MKRATIVIALISFFLCALAADTSAYYPVRVDVVKVYAHADGYQVVYRKGSFNMASLNLPARWFAPGGKAAMIYANDPSYPYMTVFYKDGKFDHLKIYVQSNRKDTSWGTLSPSEGAGKFGSEDFVIEY
jgi:hypothetical protein